MALCSEALPQGDGGTAATVTQQKSVMSFQTP